MKVKDKIKNYNEEIDNLRINYVDIMRSLPSIKKIKLFNDLNSTAISIQNKINDIEKKIKFIKNGLPENGLPDNF